jgi:hypothetical protein
MIGWVKAVCLLVPLFSLLMYHTDTYSYLHALLIASGTAGGPVLTSSAGNWTYIGTNRGVETYIKRVPGTNLLAFRGVILLDMHISRAMGPYMDLALAPDWVSMLKHIQRYPLQEQQSSLFGDADEQDLVHQVSPHWLSGSLPV